MALFLGACGGAGENLVRVPEPAPAGMVWIPPGEFTMGDERGLADERPAHRVRLHGFWLDAHEVTNADFEAFVAATGHLTTAEREATNAELGLAADVYVPPENRVPGSLVLDPPEPGERVTSAYQWWRWQPGANWRHPEGPGSNLAGRERHPVVHVSHDDAVAFAAWAKKRLPTEAEWERAARGGAEGLAFVWGDSEAPEGRWLANVWQGPFPSRDEVLDGFSALAPVGSFPPNGFGLYDMAGNAWEWCADWYRPDVYAARASALVVDPEGPMDSFDPDEPGVKKRVTRGGSFLCSKSYCAGYRPSARMKSSPDTGLMHTGFRCARDAQGE
jgi:formylglycine-generating enzyme required for sulfatase activity